MPIKVWILISTFLVVIAGNNAWAEEVHFDHHDHDAQIVNELKLDHGKKWKTDAPLRSGMTSIQSLIKKNLKAIHEGKLKDTQYVALSDSINTQLASIFKNCKLEPEADQMLHIVLAQIMDGAGKMKAEGPIDARQKGARKVFEALSDYGNFFDHPGWKRTARLKNVLDIT